MHKKSIFLNFLQEGEGVEGEESEPVPPKTAFEVNQPMPGPPQADNIVIRKDYDPRKGSPISVPLSLFVNGGLLGGFLRNIPLGPIF